MAFATYMKDLRLHGNESQVNMAKILDVSVTAIKLIENGITKFPSEKMLQKICEYSKSNPIDVMIPILFEEKSIELNYFTCKYLAYMYLKGWNVVTDFSETKKSKNKEFAYDAKIVKKRENKNVVYIVHIKKYLKSIDLIDKIFNNEVLDLIPFIAIKSMQIQESFRGLHILFDGNDENEKKLYGLLRLNEYRHIDFYVDAILFDSDNGKIEGSKRLKE